MTKSTVPEIIFKMKSINIRAASVKFKFENGKLVYIKEDIDENNNLLLDFIDKN